MKISVRITSEAIEEYGLLFRARLPKVTMAQELTFYLRARIRNGFGYPKEFSVNYDNKARVLLKKAGGFWLVTGFEAMDEKYLKPAV